MRKRFLYLLFLFSFSFFHLKAQICANPGKDGNGINLSGIINSYYPGIGTASSGSQTLQVGTINPNGSSKPITAGDLLLIIQIQNGTIVSTNDSTYGNGVSGSGYTSLGNTGLYEYVLATSGVVGGSVSIIGNGLGNGLINSYISQDANATQGQSTFQVVRVPQYGLVQLSSGLTAAYWNGTSGGILAFDVAGSLYLNSANLNVNGRGFRGGGGTIQSGGTGSTKDYAQSANANIDGSKGEGIAGTPKFVLQNNIVITNNSTDYPNGSFARGAPGNAGGGGTDGDPINNDQNSGGGGGANQGAGGNGGKSAFSKLNIGGLGGASLPGGNQRAFFGGGGGAGSRKIETGFASSGGSGGGMIFIRSGSVVGSGTMSANGNSAQNTTTDGGGGGGAGGSIIIASLKGSNNGLNLIANGGSGASTNLTGVDSSVAYGPGGGGGGGLIITSDPAITNQVFGSINGISTLSNTSFGATTGTYGKIISSSAINFQTGIQSGAACSADQNIQLSVNNSSPLVGGLVVFTLTATNNGPNSASNSKVTDTLPTGYQYVSDNGSGAYNHNSGIWTLGNLASGSSLSLTITARVLGSGVYNNTAVISSISYDPVLGDNTASISTSPYALPITKPDSTQTLTNVPVLLFNITGNDITGSFPINTSAVDLDTLTPGVQSSIVVSGKGTFTVQDTSTILFTPVKGFSGIAQAYYTVSDQFGNSSVSSSSLTVKVYPVAVRDTAITGSFIPVTVNVGAKDLGLINLKSLKILTNPINGIATADTLGNILYSPKAGFSGTDSISYGICDLTVPKPLCSSPGILIIKVGSVVLPIPVSDSLQLYSGSSGTLPNLISNDIKGTYSINPASIDLDTLKSGIQDSLFISGKGSFKVSSTGTLVFTPVPGFSGIVKDYYTVADTFGNRSTSKALIKILVNPFAVNDTISSRNGAIKVVKVWLNDLGRINPKTVKINTPPLHGTATVDTMNGNLIYTPVPGYYGKDSLAYTLCDSTLPKPLCSNSAELTIRDYHFIITPPTPIADSANTVAGKAVTLLTITQNDIKGSYPIDSTSVDLDTLAAGIQTIKIIPGKGTFLVDNFGDVRFTPVKGFSGLVSTYYSISDIYGDPSSVNAQILVKVFPKALNDSAKTTLNNSVLIPVLNNDLGNLNLASVQIASPPQNGKYSINPLNGNITYTPNSAYYGKDSLSYTVCDNTKPIPLCSSPAWVYIMIASPVVKTPYADIALTSQGNLNVFLGDTITYTLTITNNGPNTGKQIVLSNIIPTGTNLVSNSYTSFYGTVSYDANSNTLGWKADSLLVGQVVTLTFKVITVSAGTVTNTASISSGSMDTILANNTTSLKTTVTEIQFFVPKAFTPNGDGKNDLFQIGGLDPYPDNFIEIYNRWGNLVYKTTGYGKNGSNWWDGSGLYDGTYYYFLHINLGTKTKVLSGYVTILRNLNH